MNGCTLAYSGKMLTHNMYECRTKLKGLNTGKMLRHIHMYECMTKLKGLIIPPLTLTLFCHCGVFLTWLSGLHIEVLSFLFQSERQ